MSQYPEKGYCGSCVALGQESTIDDHALITIYSTVPMLLEKAIKKQRQNNPDYVLSERTKVAGTKNLVGNIKELVASDIDDEQTSEQLAKVVNDAGFGLPEFTDDFSDVLEMGARQFGQDLKSGLATIACALCRYSQSMFPGAGGAQDV